LRGTYAGLACPAVLDHLVGLGVTAVELLPVHQFRTEPVLRRRGVRNYWGYSTLSWFAPHGAYSASGDTGGQVAEFRAMVRALHDAGLEVLIDVVYNHTCEGGRDEPALSWRGLDDGAMYRRDPHGNYVDVTGCGNTVRTDHPTTLRLLLDSLRYWVREMGVDGFRFDLAPSLARTDRGIDTFAAPLAAMAADPVLQRVRLIAEPWDLGADGYLVGRFPAGWSEWNDRYRDSVRDVWRGHGVRGLASSLCGSSELYASTYRGPLASVNYVTSHDDYTLRDLVSYEHRRNLANGEGNRDGHSDSHSWNTGVEGETDDPAVVALRQRRAACMLTTLLLSAGVPMLLAGDELGRTQRGNNNAYCLDDETTWVDWESYPGIDPARHSDWQQLTPLVGHLLALRHTHPVLRPDRFPSGRQVSWQGQPEQPEISWFGADGQPMSEQQWSDESLTGLAMCRADADDAFLLVVQAGGTDAPWRLPWSTSAAGYEPVLDTGAPGWALGKVDRYEPGATLTLRAWSAVLLRCCPD
jgi:glycogen operon protein